MSTLKDKTGMPHLYLYRERLYGRTHMAMNLTPESCNGNQRPWLSIVIPAYNGEKYLEGCVASINPAVHDGVEVIIVDDGSTDSTPEVADNLARSHANVRAIHRENGGLPAARNTGVACAAGDYVWFVDCDDLVSPHTIDLIRQALDAHDTDGMVLHLEHAEFADGSAPIWSQPAMDDCQVVSSEDYQRAICTELYGSYLWSYVFPVALFNGPDGGAKFRADESFSLYEDVVTMQQLLHGPVSFVCLCHGVVYGYRMSASSMVHRPNNASAESGLRAVRAYMGFSAPSDVRFAKILNAIHLLWGVFAVTCDGAEGNQLRREIAAEAESLQNQLGGTRLSLADSAKCLMMRHRLIGFYRGLKRTMSLGC